MKLVAQRKLLNFHCRGCCCCECWLQFFFILSSLDFCLTKSSKKNKNWQNVGGQTMLSGTRNPKPIMRGIRHQPRKNFKSTFKKTVMFMLHFTLSLFAFDFSFRISWKSFCSFVWFELSFLNISGRREKSFLVIMNHYISKQSTLSTDSKARECECENKSLTNQFMNGNDFWLFA